MGRGAAFIRLGIILAAYPAIAGAQFSPGPLSKAHHSLAGPTQCTSCHLAGGGKQKFRCLSCHAEIRQRLAANRGLHPSLLGANRRDDQCIKCHSEHNGENFVPIRWDVSLDEFDHRKTGYALAGGHAGLQCNRCHNPQNISAANRHDIRMKDLRRSYLGLSRECLGCHQDEHKGQLGTNCERCHTTGRWKDVTRFDHSTAKFQLTGAHARVVCEKCHTGAPRQIRYVGIAFARCGNCHQDPHRGSFAAACTACHTVVAWKPVRNTVAAFDHGKTKFPLLGKHAGLACDKCHRGSDFKAPVAHDRCNACHQDIHKGQFITRAGHGECGGCHTVDGWKPSTFNVAAHAASAYPLLGRHAAVACAECHKPAGAATAYRVAHEQCVNCHRDVHGAQFADAAHQNRCESCHTVDRFQPAKFTLARHEQTRFRLEGAHAAVACGDCHKKQPNRPDVVAYRFPDLSCTGCHWDPHQGQFQQRMASATTPGCAACHNVRTWREVAQFDHSTTRFALTGAHLGVSCEQCHRDTAVSTGLRRVVFQNTPRACESCHEDIHAGQFTALSGTSGCAACHDNRKWRPAEFDHSKTAFQLTGAHARVPCGDCHKNKKEINGRLVVIYKPTPKDCASCHGPAISE